MADSQRFVWVVETGEYEAGHVVGVADSLEAAIDLAETVQLANHGCSNSSLTRGPLNKYDDSNYWMDLRIGLRAHLTSRFEFTRHEVHIKPTGSETPSPV